MSARIFVATMLKNEAGRFLRSALSAWSTFADEILVLDDGSTDETAEIAREAGAHVMHHTGEAAWGAESRPRRLLWDAAAAVVPEGDYIFVLDGDMVPARDPRPLLENAPDALALRLYDLWEQREDGTVRYRADGYWMAHQMARVWCVKNPPAQDWVWSRRGIHCGHFPLNLPIARQATAPKDFSLLHYAYIDAELRQQKYKQYLNVLPQLSTIEWNHAASILDEDPLLVRLPFQPELTLER